MLHASPFFHGPDRGASTRLAIVQHSDVPASVVRVASATIASCDLLPGVWVTLRSATRSRVARLEADDTLPRLTAAVSRLLAFNLGLSGGDDDDDDWVDLTPGGTWITARNVRIKTDAPPVAKSVTLARVKSPNSSATESYVAQLKAFFSVRPPRLLHEGDVLEIPSSAADASSDKPVDLYAGPQDDDDDAAAAAAKQPVYFTVSLVEADAPDAVVDVVATKLAAAGAANSRIPPSTWLADVVVPSLSRLVVPAVQHQLALCVLLTGPKGAGKMRACAALAAQLGVHLIEASLAEVRGLPAQRAHDAVEAHFERARDVRPCILVLRGAGSLAAAAAGAPGRDKPEDPDLVASAFWKARETPDVVVVATAEQADDVPQLLRGCFTHEIALPAPDLAARTRLLGELLAQANVHPDVSADKLAALTAGRTQNELKAVLANAGVHAVARRAEQLSESDFDKAVDALPSALETSAAAPKIPAVYWDDVGGLKHAKDEILDLVQAPLRTPELYASGLRARSGILLFGPPGTGKTLLAKAVATECKLNFLSVKGPELLDMYIGESERKVRQVFETARNARPCVLFFDELDSLAPARGRGSDSGGVMDRVVSQLLTELDGMQGNTDVFVMGATNRPDLLDPSLMRPGRLDRNLFLGVASEPEEQLKIVRALTRKYHHAPDVDLQGLVLQLPRNLTGADFYALCSNAMANALKRRVKELKALGEQRGLPPSKLLATLPESELHVEVTMADYNLARMSLVPSVSEKELAHYEVLRKQYAAGGARLTGT